MPVADMGMQFLKPALYDDLLTIVTTIVEPPSARIRFEYDVFNEAGEKLTKGHSVLFFLDAERRRPCRVPENLSKALAEKF